MRDGNVASENLRAPKDFEEVRGGGYKLILQPGVLKIAVVIDIFLRKRIRVGALIITDHNRAPAPLRPHGAIFILQAHKQQNVFHLYVCHHHFEFYGGGFARTPHNLIPGFLNLCEHRVGGCKE